LTTIAEAKFYLVATDKKFYVGRAHGDNNSVLYTLDLVNGYKVYEMRTYPDTNDIYVLTDTKLEALVFRPTDEVPKHPNCDSDATNIFDRICTTCDTSAPKTAAKSPSTNPPQICKTTNVATGLDSNKRMPTTDYYNYEGWP
jgi:hypothetical protein